MRANVHQHLIELQQTGRMPSPSGVALKIVELAKQDDASTRDVARVLQADPAMAARILKLANSPERGLVRPIVAVQDAVTVLGLNLVKRIALGFSLLAQHHQGRCSGFDYPLFWSRSLACGIAARVYAASSRAAVAEECFTAGLLLGIGELALATVHPTEYSELRAAAAESGVPERLARERERFLVDSRELTVAMLAEWGVPNVFAEAIQYHDNPDDAALQDNPRVRQVAQMLGMATHIATMCVGDDEVRTRELPAMYLLGARLGLDEQTLTQTFAAITREWCEWGAMLNIPAHAVPGLGEISAARTQLARRQVPAADSPLSRPMRILVVEDNPTDALLLQTLLESLGHTATVAGDGREALSRAVADSPEVVITDWNMPQMDGVELCEALRATQFGRHVYIMMLTGNDQEEHLYTAFRAGADDFLTKPLRAREVEARLYAAQRIVDVHVELLRDLDALRAFNGELAVANRRLQEAAMLDFLTGLPNRRFCLERLVQEAAAAKRSGSPLSLLLVDIDHFKIVNDTYGHDVGDQVLQQAAKVLRTHARAGETFGRFGGEEFICICPGTGASEAVQFAERLRSAVAQQPLSAANVSRQITISIGVSTLPFGTSDITRLLKHADESLYAAKHAGRNRVGPFAEESA
jgi:diguanylate cyclase (GGDEF)-like protein